MSKELKVGLLIAIGAIILVVAVFMIGDQEGAWKSKYILRIKYTEVYGLLPGSPVRLSGLRVGTVAQIEFSDAEPGTLIVTLRIDKKAKPLIHRDAKAMIGTLGLLGDKTIEVNPGTPTEPILEDGGYLQPGKSSSIEGIIAEGGELVENLKEAARHTKEVIEKINNGTGSFGLFVNDPNVYFDLQKLIVLTENLTSKLETGQGSFAKFVTDSTFYVEMRNLLKNTNNLFDSLSTGKGSIAQLMHDPKPYEDLRSIISTWKDISDKVNSGQGTAGQLLKNDSLFINLNRTLDRAEALLQDFRENPGRYIKLRIF